jgi:prepilin-type processing-associated H-X9-DG protein
METYFADNPEASIFNCPLNESALRSDAAINNGDDPGKSYRASVGLFGGVSGGGTYPGQTIDAVPNGSNTYMLIEHWSGISAGDAAGSNRYAWASSNDFKGNPFWGGLNFPSHENTGDSGYLFVDGHVSTESQDPAADATQAERDKKCYVESWDPIP